MAGFGSRTQGVPVSIAFNYNNHAPAAADGPGASRSVDSGVVNLGWTDAVHRRRRSLRGLAFRPTTSTFAKLADDAITRPYKDLAVTNGTTYYYKVRTVDTEGFGGLLHERSPRRPTSR